MTKENMWDKRYSEDGFAYGILPNDFLRENITILPSGGRVLCLAEGEGRNSVFLAKQGFDVVAVDASAVGLKKAEELAQNENVTLTTIVADLAEYEFEKDSFDAVISIFCHLPPSIRERVHKAIPPCLKPGGVVLLEGYTPEQLHYKTGGPPQENMMVTLSMLKAEIPSLTLLHGKELLREIVEGRLHTGLGSVVQFIAQKQL